jgi:hypothetical protein
MSFHYEVVVSAYLRQEIAESVLPELRWHCGLGPPPDDLRFGVEQLFGPEDVSYLPGGEITRLQQETGTSWGPTWGMFVRRFMLDDGFYELLSPISRLLASVAVDGFAGYFREEGDLLPTILVVRGGHTYFVEPNGQTTPATGGPAWNPPRAGSS